MENVGLSRLILNITKCLIINAILVCLIVEEVEALLESTEGGYHTSARLTCRQTHADSIEWFPSPIFSILGQEVETLKVCFASISI